MRRICALTALTLIAAGCAGPDPDLPPGVTVNAEPVAVDATGVQPRVLLLECFDPPADQEQACAALGRFARLPVDRQEAAASTCTKRTPTLRVTADGELAGRPLHLETADNCAVAGKQLKPLFALLRG